MPAVTGRVPARDGGFTVVELTVAVAILGILMAAVMAAILVAQRAMQEASARIDVSVDLRTLSTYVGPDAGGANTFAANNQPGVSAAPASPDCGPTGDTLVVQFAGPDPVDLRTDRSTVVSYVLQGAGQQVVRRACADPSTAPDDERVVASGLAPGSPPTVTCRTRSRAVIACASAPARTVELTVTAADGTTHTIVGSRRPT